ncbi:MAG: hypothetical protein SOZ47_07265 [Lawsonibacter sp.]|nr:hypothetical protein [Lawsonibacter sp.]
MFLSDNDWSRLALALREMREDRVEVTMGRTSIEVQTARAGRGWTVAMIVGVVLRRDGEVRERQWVESVEVAREIVRRWEN